MSRVTPADLALLRQCRRSKTAFTEERVLFRSEYRRKGTVRSFYLIHDDTPPTLVTPRIKRLLSMGLVECSLFIHNYGPDGGVVLTEAGRAALDAAPHADRGSEQ